MLPLGSGTVRLSQPSPGPWPGGEPVSVLPGGDVVRLVDGRDLERYSSHTAAMTRTRLPELDHRSARPGAVTMQPQPDGALFITNPAIGRALVVDPARSVRVTALVDYAPPASRLGGPASKAALSADGQTLYTLAPAAAGGLMAYHTARGTLRAVFGNGSPYVGVYPLPSGAVLAVSATSPRLHFFTGSLAPVGTTDTALNVVEVL